MSFSTDRRWMYEMTINGYHNLKYGENVDKFLDFAYSNHGSVERKLNSSGEIVYQIKCPCTRCKNIHYREREVVENHLLSRGFKPNYYTWDEHGETFINEVGVGQSSPMEDDQTDDDVDDDNDDDDDLCRRMVLDSMHPTGHGEEHVPNKNAKGFYDMLHNAEKPLWDGCSDWSTLQAATSLLNWKSHCNVTVAAFNHILPIFKSMLPKRNNLPENFYETKNLLHKLRLPSERIDACKNHCMLFYKEDLELSHCRWCGESRYKSGKKKVLNLVLTYMPIGPRLQKLYMSTKTAKEMTWHYDNKTKEKHMAHPRDGKAWKHFDETHPSFVEEIRNVRLGLCTDGFSPNSMTSSPYSSWPVFLSIYNLPPWMSLKDSYVKLCLVIPGRKSPGQNLDVFLRPLIDELIHLYDVGIETYDAFRKQNFTMRAILLWTISDFLAYAMLSGWSTHGRYIWAPFKFP